MIITQVCSLCFCALLVTTADFAKEEDSAIAKLQAANELIQSQIDQQRARLFIVEQEITNLTQKL